MATLDDVAEAAGVGHRTAWAAFHDPERISPRTRQKVLDAARRLNYVPGSYGYASERRVAVVTTTISRYGLVDMVHAATTELQNAGYTVSHITLNPHISTIPAFDDLEGALLVGVGLSFLPLLQPLLQLNKPIVCMQSDVAAALGVTEVTNDAERGIYDATTHLLRLGHSQIALLNMALESATARRVLQGYMRAMVEQNISLPMRLLLEGDGSANSGYNALQALLRNSPPPQALVCASDEMAIGALQALSNTGLRVPDDVAITSMGDVEAAAFTQPALTTVRIHTTSIGQTAASTLLQRLNGLTSGDDRILIPNSFILRDSCGATQTRHQLSSPTSRYPRHKTTTPARIIPIDGKREQETG